MATKKLLRRLILPAAVILAAYGVYLYMRPLPAAVPVYELVSPPAPQSVSIPWPSSGQAALGAGGYGLLASHNSSQPVPIASIAKIITALAILEKKPLAAGAQGPTITFSQKDVDLFDYYYTRDGSVAQVKAGETLTQYQAMQAMLLPSANNMADSLANWAFGSVDAYTAYANNMVKGMGLAHTTVADASGFTDNTLSTADDLVKLGLAAVSQPAIAQIVGQTSADIPVAGTVHNVNWLLGNDGVDGIKTGNTDKAGGCYLFAASHTIAGQPVTLVGAVLGLPQLNDAISASRPILDAADSGFSKVTVIHKGQTMAKYQTAWGQTSSAYAAQDLTVVAWKDKGVRILNQPGDIKAPASAGAEAGQTIVVAGQKSVKTRLVLTQNIQPPSWHWRIFQR